MKFTRHLAAALAVLMLVPAAASCSRRNGIPADTSGSDDTFDNSAALTLGDGQRPENPSDSTGNQATEPTCPLQFSHAPGFYDKSFDLTLTVPEGWTVYYTENGTDPRTSSSRKTYTQPITLYNTYDMAWGPAIRAWNKYAGRDARPASNTMPGGYVIKAYAEKNGEQTAVYTASYFIAAAFKRYGVKMVSLSLPVDEMLGADGFYSNYNPYDDYTATRPRGTASMEIFTPDGVRISHSTVELAVSGNGSSGAMMKSLRVYYKKSLNRDGNQDASVQYDLFDGLALDQSGAVITDFSRLVLRNSGNDCGSSYLRDAYMQRVCAGLRIDTLASTTVMVFVNGEFWGIYNLRERYSPEYVEAHYGVDKDNVCIIENDYSHVHDNNNVPYVVCNGEEGDADDFNQLVAYMKSNNLSDPRVFEKVASQLDLDSFIDMYVARLYFNARDWPENNIKVWRNKNPDDPSGFDTKWHFTLLDMDMGLAYYTFTDYRDSIFELAFNRYSVCATMMTQLLKNPDFKNAFIARYYELVTEYFTPDRLLPVFEDMYAERKPLMVLQAGRWPGDGASVDAFASTCDDIRTFIEKRQKNALRQFCTQFKITEAEAEAIYQSCK